MYGKPARRDDVVQGLGAHLVVEVVVGDDEDDADVFDRSLLAHDKAPLLARQGWSAPGIESRVHHHHHARPEVVPVSRPDR